MPASVIITGMICLTTVALAIIGTFEKDEQDENK